MKTAKIPATNQEFPIGKIVCLARNYAEHARELGNETPAAPVLFMKPAIVRHRRRRNGADSGLLAGVPLRG